MTKRELKWLGAGAGLGVVLISLLAAVPSQTDFDPAYFRTNALPITLVGTLTNWAKLSTNVANSTWTDFGTFLAPSGGTNFLHVSTSNSIPDAGTVFTMIITNGGWVGGNLVGSDLLNSAIFQGGSTVAGGLKNSKWNSLEVVGGSELRGSLGTSTNITAFLAAAGEALISGNTHAGDNININATDGSLLAAHVSPGASYSSKVGSIAAGDLGPIYAANGSIAVGQGIYSDFNSFTFGVNITNTAGGLAVGYNGVTSLYANSSGTRVDKGISSLATDSFLTFTATGLTNSLGKVGVARFDGTTLTYVVKDNANTPVYTNTVSVGHATEIIQAGGAIVITAGSASGTMSPF